MWIIQEIYYCFSINCSKIYMKEKKYRLLDDLCSILQWYPVLVMHFLWKYLTPFPRKWIIKTSSYLLLQISWTTRSNISLFGWVSSIRSPANVLWVSRFSLDTIKYTIFSILSISSFYIAFLRFYKLEHIKRLGLIHNNL